MGREHLELEHLERVDRLIAGTCARIERLQECVDRLKGSGLNAAVAEETLEMLWVTLCMLRAMRGLIEQTLRMFGQEGGQISRRPAAPGRPLH